MKRPRAGTDAVWAAGGDVEEKPIGSKTSAPATGAPKPPRAAGADYELNVVEDAHALPGDVKC